VKNFTIILYQYKKKKPRQFNAEVVIMILMNQLPKKSVKILL